MDERSPEKYAEDTARALGLCSKCGAPLKGKNTILDPSNPEDAETMVQLANGGFVQQEPVTDRDRWLGTANELAETAQDLHDARNTIVNLGAQLALLLEPMDAEHVGKELDWLLKQDGNVGTAAFQVMKAFAQKNAELANVKQVRKETLDLLKAEPCGLCGQPLGEEKPREAAGCLHRHQRRRSAIAELEKFLK